MNSCSNSRTTKTPTNGPDKIRTMKKFLLILIVIAGYCAGNATASDLVLADRDCAEILELWANDPDSVSQHLVDGCKEQMSLAVPAIAPMAGTAVAKQVTDPCAGAGAAGSLNLWGPWSALAPAASGISAPANPVPVEEYQVRPELAAQFAPSVASCIPGTPCGFATIVDGVSGQAPGADTTIAQFDLASDGSQFTVAPGQAGEIASVGGLLPSFIDRPDGYENMRANGAAGNQVSGLIARVTRDGDGNIIASADWWGNANTDTLAANSGFYAWGVSMSQTDVNALNNAAVSAVFSGAMSVDNRTAATITLNFGASPNWTGEWTNPGYAFDAGGTLVGVDLISDPAQFSSNVGADSFVQGALLGDGTNKSIAHVIDVDVAGVGRIKDVGLLRE